MEIELGDAVAALRQEVLEAARRGAGSSLEFAVGPIEMEFVVELRADLTAKAGVKAYVLTGNAEGKRGRTRTQKVRITLTPKRPDGRDLLVSGEPGTFPDDNDAAEPIGR